MIETAAAGVNARIGDLRASGGGFSAKLLAARRAKAAAMTADATADGASAQAIAATDGDDTLFGTDQDDNLQGGLGNDTLRGRGGNDQIQGDEGNDLLDGGTGGDRMLGGVGDDTFLVDDAGDTAIELLDSGIDTVRSTAAATTLGNHVENLILLGDLARNGAGNALANAITGNAQANKLTGGNGDDTLSGGAAADLLTGGRGNDVYYVDVTQDRVVEALGEGKDTVQSAVALTLAANVENLVLTGSAAISGRGNDLSNTITGNSGSNRLDGGMGADILAGKRGDDFYVTDYLDQVIEASGEGTDTVSSYIYDYVLPDNVENLVLLSELGTGNGLANRISANVLDNTIDGAGGADTMIGGAGDDIYYVDDQGDAVVERAGEGSDFVYSSVSFRLAGNAEALILVGTAAIDGTGTSAADEIFGNAGANRLDGGLGTDRLVGGGGNDTYVIETPGDEIVEASSAGGTDTVITSYNYTLEFEGKHVENLVLGGSSDLRGIGNTLNNRITGNSGANRLNGMEGADRLTGAGGNDTYVVDNAGDRAVELAGGGVDTVEAYASHLLGANVENLVLNGSGLIGTGNGLDNVMTGSDNGSETLNGGSGDDSLSGGEGADILIGGAGTDTLAGGEDGDTYVIDSLSDKIVENGRLGHDTVNCPFSYVLGEFSPIENLVLAGRSAINGTGNGGMNRITGNAAANVLDGGGGSDTLVGGGGNDRYILDTAEDSGWSAGDQVVELADGGIDTVETSVGYQMNDHVENAILTGADNVWCTGNGLANTITGNAGSNSLIGNGGGDMLAGGAGDDFYEYILADDTIVERADGGVDWVYSIADHVLAANVENVSLLYSGTRDIDATGNGLANFVGGGEGDNVLDGGAGDDTLSGLKGTDVLTGGTGVDAFNFGSSLGNGVDTITDFNAANETVNLFKSSFTALGDVGELAAGAFHTGSAAQAADDRIIYNKATGNIFYDADGSGSGAAVMFTRVTAGTELTHANFEVL